MTLEDQILSLDPATAVSFVRGLATALPQADIPAALDDSMLDQLRREAELGTEPCVAVDEGDLARAALLLMARDRQHRAGITTLLNHPPVASFAVGETTLIVSAVLIVLQAHIRFRRDKDGKWTVTIEKKPTDPGLLKDFIKKLISFQ